MTIGDKVEKISGKPFKSGNKVNTIKAFCINEQHPKKVPAVSFNEDSSVVDLFRLKKIETSLVKYTA
jgi:hypothetical protein